MGYFELALYNADFILRQLLQVACWLQNLWERCKTSPFGLMLRSPKRDIPKTLHKIFCIVHDQLRFTIHGSSSPAPALHGWSSLCKAAKSKEIYASTTDASRPKGLALHQYTFWHPAGISITSCLQQCSLYHLVFRLNEAFTLCQSCISVECCEASLIAY